MQTQMNTSESTESNSDKVPITHFINICTPFEEGPSIICPTWFRNIC